MSHLVFLYGSLKRGNPRNSVLEDQRYLGTALTIPDKYTLYQLQAGYPALVENTTEMLRRECKRIWGELYEVSETCIDKIDVVESVSHGLYKREFVDLEGLHLANLPLSDSAIKLINQKKAECYFYCNSVEGARDIGSFWTSHR